MSGSFVMSTDTDFIISSLKKIETDLEEASIQKRDYQSLVSGTVYNVTSSGPG